MNVVDSIVSPFIFNREVICGKVYYRVYLYCLLDTVSLYVHVFKSLHDCDLNHELAKEMGFQLYPKVLDFIISEDSHPFLFNKLKDFDSHVSDSNND